LRHVTQEKEHASNHSEPCEATPPFRITICFSYLIVPYTWHQKGKEVARMIKKHTLHNKSNTQSFSL
ncbi:MAG: hypothetical protein IJ684_00445, partial [Bacteroidales bacterium]|nr:hypothetical protein [Bacteroidales bacterium]